MSEIPYDSEDQEPSESHRGRKIAAGLVACLVVVGVGDHFVTGGDLRNKILGGGDDGAAAVSEQTTTAPEVIVEPAFDKPIVVLDPGHHDGTAEVPPYTGSRPDPITGLRDDDFASMPEAKDVFDVTLDVKAQLEAAGIEVLMTKDSVSQVVYLRDRANVAVNASADLAVSIHCDDGMPQGVGEIYPQFVGGYRGEPANRVTFADSNTAALSMQYSEAIRTARVAAQGIDIKIKNNTFNGRTEDGEKLEPGDLSFVQLYASTVPWVYNETGCEGGMNKETYADGLAAGITGIIQTLEQSAAPGTTN